MIGRKRFERTRSGLTEQKKVEVISVAKNETPQWCVGECHTCATLNFLKPSRRALS